MALVVRNLTASVVGENESKRILFENLCLQVDEGDIRVINGPSGCGKSTLLRALACLDPVENLNSTKPGDPILTLNGHTPDAWGFACWRTQVHYVHQKPPPFLGTPREFYNLVRSFKAQRTAHSGKFPQAVRQSTIDAQMKRRLEVEVHDDEKATSSLLQSRQSDHTDSYWTDPIQIAESWAIPPSRFDRAWSSLSGGECQRVFLAISVALRPLVLLIDEPTSALDHGTALLVEDTLLKSGLTILWVTHDTEQIQRLNSPVFLFPVRKLADESAGEEASPSRFVG